MGQLSGYGDADYFSLPGHANRTLSVEVIATDESGNSSTQKAQPVIGMWSLAAPEGTTPPAFTPSSFNVATVGMTQLDAELLESTQFRIGIADIRGDGRPDFRYRARVLYGDGVIPDRVSARGGMPILIEGLGFRAGMTLTLGSIPLTLLAVSATELVATVPALPDGVQTLHITDPSSGGSSTLASALTLGAGPNDMLRLTQGTNSATAVGAEAGYPIRVTVTNSDGSLPVGGATVQWNSTNQAGLTACNGAATCSVFTDESGQSETRVTVGATGLATITASLAPASYMPPKFVQTSVSGVSSSKDLALFSPKVYVAQGATLTVPFTARLLGNGAPLGGQTLNWKVGIGTGTMSPASIVTDGDGYGRSTLRLTNLAGDVQGTVCLAPSNNPCQTFYVVPVASSVIKLQAVAGSLQTIVVGQSFQPIWVRAINSATPPNPVMGVSVTFQNMIFMPDADAPVEVSGDDGSSQHAMKVLLGTSQGTLVTDVNGLASWAPSTGGFLRPLEIEISASTGTATPLQFELPMLSAPAPALGASTGKARVPVRLKSRLGSLARRGRPSGLRGDTKRMSGGSGVIAFPVPREGIDCAAKPWKFDEKREPPPLLSADGAAQSSEEKRCGDNGLEDDKGVGADSIAPR